MNKIFAFITVFLVSMFMLWLSGYDFNHRGEFVSIWFASSVIASFFATLFFKTKKEDHVCLPGLNKFIGIVIIVLFFVLTTAWLGGQNLDRSPELVAIVFGSLFLSCLIWGVNFSIIYFRLGPRRHFSNDPKKDRYS